MSVENDGSEDMLRAAYRIAWVTFNQLPRLTPDEMIRVPARLRDYIATLVMAGERDAEKIARSALGLVRQYEQILQSQARLQLGEAS